MDVGRRHTQSQRRYRNKTTQRQRRQPIRNEHVRSLGGYRGVSLRPTTPGSTPALDVPRHQAEHPLQIFILVVVEEVLELCVQRFEPPLDEHALACLGQLVVRALVQVELDTSLLLLESRLRLTGRTDTERSERCISRTRHRPAGDAGQSDILYGIRIKVIYSHTYNCRPDY